MIRALRSIGCVPLGILLGGLALMGGPWLRPAAGAGDQARDLMAEERRMHEATFPRLPSAGRLPLAEVLRLEMDPPGQGMLVVHTKLMTSGQTVRVNVEELDGAVTVLSVHSGEQLLSFTLHLRRFEEFGGGGGIGGVGGVEGEEAMVSLRLNWRPGRLNVVDHRIRQGRRGERTRVMLMQEMEAEPDRATARANRGPVNAFRVVGHRFDAAGELLEVINVASADAGTLRMEHPAVFARYVRPILRELGAAALGGADEELARVVFSEAFEPEPGVLEQVRKLLVELDAPQLARREAATRELMEMGLHGAMALRRVDRSELTPEQNARLDGVLEARMPLSEAQARALRGDVVFLLECMVLEEAHLAELAAAELARVTGRRIAFDASAEQAKRVEAVSALRRELGMGE